MTTITSQESHPNWSISARDIGNTGATPKRRAQYGRRENKAGGGLMSGNDMPLLSLIYAINAALISHRLLIFATKATAYRCFHG